MRFGPVTRCTAASRRWAVSSCTACGIRRTATVGSAPMRMLVSPWQPALGDAVDRVLQGDDAGGRVVLERLAQRRQRQPLRPACEQADVEQLLELAQGLGHGGLRHRQLIGGAADMTQPRHLHEALEMADLHARIDHAASRCHVRCRDYRTVIACRQVLISDRRCDRSRLQSAGGFDRWGGRRKQMAFDRLGDIVVHHAADRPGRRAAAGPGELAGHRSAGLGRARCPAWRTGSACSATTSAATA